MHAQYIYYLRKVPVFPSIVLRNLWMISVPWLGGVTFPGFHICQLHYHFTIPLRFSSTSQVCVPQYSVPLFPHLGNRNNTTCLIGDFQPLTNYDLKWEVPWIAVTSFWVSRSLFLPVYEVTKKLRVFIPTFTRASFFLFSFVKTF